MKSKVQVYFYKINHFKKDDSLLVLYWVRLYYFLYDSIDEIRIGNVSLLDEGRNLKEIYFLILLERKNFL
jgi:hypothetical protein